MKPDDTSPFVAEPEPAAPAGEADAQAPDREDWRGPQDDPWQLDEQAPPPVIGD
ncbi:hypothetical protein [Stackebrandtia nassauensis]|uniref:Uncharacterized protein n=1 Tax=Stackebrandtia nassauensis (strain DSM 44728 / CIP 108903 / NRRL B-16338 / NBRC 102104 / LLR-40K-21) TaxID=446470 RepID=D3Q4F5_STANL|nr:hypothetical protein [Stackebrandtia nassauensis]ADD40115.1 hypothetical protein Snas_0398 [Stackebrandtia nassauensis DSM 44728]